MFDLTTGSVTTVAGREYDVNSPQWSPDGTKIAFVSGNELFLINSNGTGATRLTNGAFPRWSPDGTQIVFESRSGVSVINSDGSGETDLAPGAWPAWSPTGAEIVFIDTDLQLSSISPDGTGLTRLTDLPNDSIGPPVWSPDGSRITFEALQGGNYDIYGMNADGTNLENLTGEPGDENMPTWSPDGMMIAFIAGESVSENPGNTMTFDVYIMKADGSEESRLTTGAAPAYALSWQSAQMATAS
jgi:TolB protein